MTRLLRSILLGVGACSAVMMIGCTSTEKPPERIVLIVVDTLRRDALSVYGGGAKTPAIDRLASSGKVWASASGSFHQTTMSMGAMFTGRTPSIESGDPRTPSAWIEPNWCGLARFAKTAESACIPAGLATLGEVMREAGYWTAASVSNRLLFGPTGFARGFDDWVEVGKPAPGAKPHSFKDAVRVRSGKHVNVAVRELLARRSGDRFFLYVHYMDVHDWYLGVASSDPEVRRGKYLHAVEQQDEFIAELVAELERLGLMEGTAIVLTGDHGEALGESHVLPTSDLHYGNPSFQQVLDVPLITTGARIPEKDGPFRSEDIYRLLASMAGAKAVGPEASPSAHPASSDLAPGEIFVTEMAYQVYRNGRWKSFVRRADGAHALVDLNSDPSETEDVAATHPDVVARHRRRILELQDRLAAGEATGRDLTARETEALRALGYLDPASD